MSTSLFAPHVQAGYHGCMSTVVERPRITADPKELVGTFRRFGSGGPVYEVVAIVDDRTAFIRVVESGEELDYPIEKIADDAEE